MSPFEIAMLVCFGAAWPFSIRRSLVSRATAGKSPVFLLVVLLGYVAGIIHKLRFAPDPVLWFYVANGLMVFLDMGLYWRNRALEKRNREAGR